MARIADYLELIAAGRRPPSRAPRVCHELNEPAVRRGVPRPGPRRLVGLLWASCPTMAMKPRTASAWREFAREGPPRKAGLKGGDLIISCGGKPIGTIYDYMESMDKHKPGDKVEVVVKRDGKDVKLKVTLGSRPRE